MAAVAAVAERCGHGKCERGCKPPPSTASRKCRFASVKVSIFVFFIPNCLFSFSFFLFPRRRSQLRVRTEMTLVHNAARSGRDCGTGVDAEFVLLRGNHFCGEIVFSCSRFVSYDLRPLASPSARAKVVGSCSGSGNVRMIIMVSGYQSSCRA